jgi:phosphoribosylglycinamide formyltransferase-1
MSNKKIHIAIFASGSGSNAAKLLEYFNNHAYIEIVLIVCNNPSAGVINIASLNNVALLMIEKEKFFRGSAYIDELKEKGVEWIVLAGFLWKIPNTLIGAFPNRIINIHPALLPKYGGKGMYGKYVHEAVLAAGEKSSGITIHVVDEVYDHGKILFQTDCSVEKTDNTETLAKKIQELEHRYFGPVLEQLLLSM